MPDVHDRTLSTQYRDLLANISSVAGSEKGGTLSVIKEEKKDPNMIPIMDFNIEELMDKRSAELTHAEKAAKNLYMVNEQVDKMDDMIQNILATSE